MPQEWNKWGLLRRFSLAGALNTALGLLVFSALVSIGLADFLAAFASLMVSVVVNFESYRRAFGGSFSGVSFGRFVIFYCFIYAVNVALLMFARYFGVGPVVAQCAFVPVLALLSFVGMSRLVFPSRRPSTN